MPKKQFRSLRERYFKIIRSLLCKISPTYRDIQTIKGEFGDGIFNKSIIERLPSGDIKSLVELGQKQSQMIEQLSQNMEKQSRMLEEQRQRFGASSFDLFIMQRWKEGLTSAEYAIDHMPYAKCFKAAPGNLPIVQKQIRDYALSKCSDDGLFLEFGVYKGTSINYFAKAKPHKTIYGFDSFEGLPEDWPGMLTAGHFSTDGNLPQVAPNVTLIKGWFNETLPGFIAEHPGQHCSFIHIDCDLYVSADIVLTLLEKMIVKGTIILFDEYFNYPSWRLGEHKAFQEFVTRTGISYEYVAYSTHQQVAVRIK